MKHYTNTNNPIDFPKKKEIPMLEKFAAQSLVEHDGELIFSKEKFAELIVRECVDICRDVDGEDNIDARSGRQDCAVEIQEHFGVDGMSTEDKKTLIKELLGVKND